MFLTFPRTHQRLLVRASAATGRRANEIRARNQPSFGRKNHKNHQHQHAVEAQAAAVAKTSDGQVAQNQTSQVPGPAAGSRPGLLGAIADGMASGLGWGMGMRLMDGIFGPRTMEVVHHDHQDASSSTDASSVDATSTAGSTGLEGDNGTSWFSNDNDQGMTDDFGSSWFGGDGGGDWDF
ncbi:hypothetical protein FOZ60_010529 [Perkinsus olseni]|uniref:Uncharacterized protein n=1 Tax=Perkinsus olseni TaxID=32597 RepID=A0A7J6PBN3_PEROL|nr:hypothetical protein FOZ60_010529 [Perkinsus olseni]